MERLPTAMRTRLRGVLAPRALALLLVVAAPLALVACGDEQPTAPSGSPSIVGIVETTTADAGGAVAFFLVVQGTGDHDKASVTVTADTAWQRTGGDEVEPIDAPPADALIGKRVEVQFTGPVAESYPVQATAGWIIVHD